MLAAAEPPDPTPTHRRPALPLRSPVHQPLRSSSLCGHPASALSSAPASAVIQPLRSSSLCALQCTSLCGHPASALSSAPASALSSAPASATVSKQICLASYLALSQLSQKYLRHHYNHHRFTYERPYPFPSAIAVLAVTLAHWPTGQGVKGIPADSISSLNSLLLPAYKDKVFAWSLGQSRSCCSYCREK